jgi:hypothetical protein
VSCMGKVKAESGLGFVAWLQVYSLASTTHSSSAS